MRWVHGSELTLAVWPNKTAGGLTTELSTHEALPWVVVRLMEPRKVVKSQKVTPGPIITLEVSLSYLVLRRLLTSTSTHP